MIGVPCGFLAVFPISLLKNMHDFRYISIFTFGCVFYTVSVALWELPQYYAVNYKPGVVVYFQVGVAQLAGPVGGHLCVRSPLPVGAHLQRDDQPNAKKNQQSPFRHSPRHGFRLLRLRTFRLLCHLQQHQLPPPREEQARRRRSHLAHALRQPGHHPPHVHSRARHLPRPQGTRYLYAIWNSRVHF